MVIDLSDLSSSDYAAWWGAVIATLALIWNIVIAIRTGARLHVSVSPNRQSLPASPGEENKKYIVVNVVNRGTSPTTITNCLGYSDKYWWARFTKNKKGRDYFIVNRIESSSPLPLKIKSGDEWRGIIDQESIFEGVGNKYLYLGVAHNQHKNPIYKRVKISA